MATEWYMFSTIEEALEASSEIAAKMGCPIVSRNFNGEPDSTTTKTEGFANPIRLVGGYGFLVPAQPSLRLAWATVIVDPEVHSSVERNVV